jgi:hypothetical protein
VLAVKFGRSPKDIGAGEFSVEWFEHPIEFAIAREHPAERTAGERGPFRGEGLVQYFDLVLDPVVWPGA